MVRTTVPQAAPPPEVLAANLPLRADEIATRRGARVKERRRTAWVTEPGSKIGALAYSGKLMAPSPMLEAVLEVRDALAGVMGDGVPPFDCALANLYPAGEDAACKFHSDPEHGTHWHRETAVVSSGEVRRFAFRRIGAEDDDRHLFHLFHGDVVHMHHACQDEWQHAVFAAEDATNSGGRVSLVFKKAIPSPAGRLGHGIPGSGATRSDRKKQRPRVSVKADRGGAAVKAGRGGDAAPRRPRARAR